MITFNDFGLNPMILQAITEMGFEKPTPIQAKTIPHLINSDNDLIALAQTGTGKTAAFSLPIIQQLDEKDPSVQSLILCPTRELAIQIAKDIEKYIKYLPGVKVTPVYGGERIDRQIREMKKKPQIVVGTPGRVNDMIRRRILKVEQIKWLVLDEADEMLNMGFKEELDLILVNMPEEKQTLLFSATMNQQIKRIATNYMNKSDEISVGNKNQGAENVQHFYYMVHEKDRYQALKRIADVNPDIHGIVFCRTRRETQKIADLLIKDHYSAEAIHGEISQEQRTHVMERFKQKKVQLLVATDVAARGIDVDKLTHVINYNPPEKTDAYVHRSGRTGRANNAGISLVIVNMREKHCIKALERKIGKSFEQGKIPSGDDVCEKQLFSLVEKVCNVEVNEEQISKYMELINKKFEKMDREELIKKFISAEFNRFLDQYQGSVDLNSNVAKDKGHGAGGGGYDKSSVLMALIKIDMGRSEGMSIKELFGFLNEQQGLRGIEVGHIKVENNYTSFEVDENFTEQVIKAFKGNATVVKTGIRTSRASGGKSRGPRRRPGGHHKGAPRHGGPRKGGRSHRKKRY